MKVFISQPMNGKSEEEILSEREMIIEEVRKIYANMDRAEKERSFHGVDIEIIDTYFNDYEIAQCKNKPLAFIAKSIEKLADADLAVFAPNYSNARGCMIEHICADRYGVKIIEL